MKKMVDFQPGAQKKPKVGVKKKVQFILPPPLKKVEKKPTESRKYAQIAPESVKIKAESIGIQGLNDDVAKALSEEVSYRLREVISKCTVYMRQSKRMKLTKSILDDVLAVNDLDYDFGNRRESTFSLIEEENLFTLNDETVNLELSANEYVEHKMKEMTLRKPKISGKLILPDRKQKPAAENKKNECEAETSEEKTVLADKESTAESENNKTTETEPLEALGLRKIPQT